MWPFGRRANRSMDPVCGMEVEQSKAAATSDYDGTTYYFCSKSCKTEFDQDPAKYLGQAETGISAHSGPHHCC